MNKSESIAKLAEALSKAQGAMRNAIKDSNNPYFKSKYADLASVSDACRTELASNGLAVSQLPETRDGQVVVTYILMHTSGEWISGELQMNPVKSDPQGIGSAITYARRYTLAAITGVATEDDDGNAAAGNSDSKKPVHSMPVERITEDIQLTRENAGQILPDTELLITKDQAAKLHMRFRENLSEALKPKADRLLHEWLGKQMYLDATGNPSAGAIKKDEFATIGKAAVAWAKELSA